MRHFPQGVTVVTFRAPSGPKGMTVSSFTSVSLQPPLVLVSIARSSELHDHLVAADAFAVNFLADDQKSVSDLFAGRVKVAERFDSIRHAPGVSGAPVIEGARAVVECRRWKVYDGGDHSLVVGEVVTAGALNDRRPLVYYNQRYTSTEGADSPAPGSDFIW